MLTADKMKRGIVILLTLAPIILIVQPKLPFIGEVLSKFNCVGVALAPVAA